MDTTTIMPPLGQDAPPPRWEWHGESANDCWVAMIHPCAGPLDRWWHATVIDVGEHDLAMTFQPTSWSRIAPWLDAHLPAGASAGTLRWSRWQAPAVRAAAEPTWQHPFARSSSDCRVRQMLGRVYFIQAVRGGPIKIGWARDIGRRMAALQPGSPYRLDVIAQEGGGRAREAQLHRDFASARLQGEWFAPTPALLAYCRNLVAAAAGGA